MNRIAKAVDLARNMGMRYIAFRVWYEIRLRVGWLRLSFPTNVPRVRPISLEEWRSSAPPFFFGEKASLKLPRRVDPALEDEFRKYTEGDLRFFHSTWYTIGTDYDWVTNPDSGYTYSTEEHWTVIPDFSATAGDIKFVWEKSRFTFLQALLRYDYHSGRDCGHLVFREIESWIASNPLNLGPNYRCSQEISLRIMNWVLALYFYRRHPALTNERFESIINSIYWQLCHVRSNIHFSRLAVRNNHALTETLMLYLAGLLFPFFEESAEWKRSGRRWFEEEVCYQIYEDGAFLQHSMNYHRVVVQLLTWAFRLSKLNEESFGDAVADRACKTVGFLFQCQDEESGWLPNYGNNDGALFFKFNDCDFSDFRPQLNALHYTLTGAHLYHDGPWREDVFWYFENPPDRSTSRVIRPRSCSFEVGGYYVIRDAKSLTFLRCCSYRDRPHQADNLHLDIWYDGANVLRDAGSFKYNADPESVRYFVGTGSHNTTRLGDHDQMLKGERFIWYFWSRADYAEIVEGDEIAEFRGQIVAYRHVDKDIRPTRIVRKYLNRPEWEVHDELKHSTGAPITQIWNLAPEYVKRISFLALDESGSRIEPTLREGWHSRGYGVKERGVVVEFSTTTFKIHTSITLR